MAKINVDVDDDRAEGLKRFIEGHIGVNDVELKMEEEVEEEKIPLMRQPSQEEESIEEENMDVEGTLKGQIQKKTQESEEETEEVDTE